jgi:hypothetical protein
MNWFKPSPKLAIIITLIINIWTSSNMNFGGQNWRSIISSDACGYYAYLPAIFIYKDLQFSHFENVENSTLYFSDYLTQDYRTKTETGVVDKYYVGCAVLWSPFFMVAHFLAEPLGYPSDGYSKPYHIAICWAAVFYLALGMYCLAKLLQKVGYSDLSIFWALLVTEFASNLFYYSVPLPSFSHVYSFSTIIMFLFFGHKALDEQNWKDWLLGALLLGIITLVRPVNFVAILFLPFLFDTWAIFWFKIKDTRVSNWILSILAFVCVIFIQLIIYKIQTGHFLVFSYEGEGFNFLHPNFWGYLFSFRKGFFLYTPIFLPLLLASGFILWKTNRYKLFALVLPLYLVWHIASSWWCWWYGSGYSQRPMVDFMFVLALLVCISFDYFNKQKKWIVVILIFFMLVTQIQTYQARYGLILGDFMTKELYFQEFLNISNIIERTK